MITPGRHAQRAAARIQDDTPYAAPAGLTGARLLCEALIHEGVDTIFGYPGGSVLPIYDELARFPHRLRHVSVRHEQGAVHMAEGYARATGRVGVVLVTSGPGLTNTITGIANARKDSTPLVVIAGQAPSSLFGHNAFQAVDAVAITRPCAKYAGSVSDPDDMPAIVHDAFRRARSGRPGPVVIEIPKDVAAGTAFVPDRALSRIHGLPSAPSVEMHVVEQVVARIEAARRPVFFVGGGVINSGCCTELVAVAEMLRVPVATTLMGLGAIPGDHSLSLGMLGMHGTYCANMALSEADLVVALGARFADRGTGSVTKFAPKAGIIHVDVDPAQIGAVVVPDIAMVADAGRVLRDMLALLRAGHDPAESLSLRLSEWWDQLSAWQRDVPIAYEPSDNEIKPQRVCEQLSRLADHDAIVTTDVGQHQMWLAQYFKVRGPRRFITSGGLGTMGFGLPAAIGARIAFPQSQVIAFVGDGGFQMTAQELATAVQYQADVKVIVMNNGRLGMVRQWQDLFYDHAHVAVDIEHMPDFVALARAYGATGLRVEHPADLESAMAEALAAPGVVVLEVKVSSDENVYPMIPPGAGSHEMVLGPSRA
jgi:acetolactate synthase I/II/III large subunit